MANGTIRKQLESVVLFDNSSGATSGTLLQSIAGYRYLKVTWGVSDVRFTVEAAKNDLSSFYQPVSYVTESTSGGNLYYTFLRIHLDGSAFSTDRNFSTTVAPTTISSSAGSAKVYRIEGFR